jgi:hypothetical protein
MALAAVVVIAVPALGGEKLLPLGLLLGAPIALFAYVLGALVAAQGQTLKASLDCAVNGSPFLTHEERAHIMSVELMDG